MAHVLVIGGGLSGCIAALELADKGHEVTIIEKSGSIGGKVRQFGCKSTDICSNCGICLSGGLWEAVESNSAIKIITGSRPVDITGGKGNFSAAVTGPGGIKTISGVTSILVSIGFERFTSESYGNLEFNTSGDIITGYQLEKLISERKSGGVFAEAPSRVAFIQCFGSRDKQENALYCSRVCCGYSTRAARVLKHYYPDTQITFFYMDLQYVEDSQYFEELTREGFEFIRCRPVKVKPDRPSKIVYEQPGTGEKLEREFDLIILSEGIHPPSDAEHIAELCTLGIDEKGFLKHVMDGSKTGIYISGCASGPKRIEEVHSESLAVARRLMDGMQSA